MQFNTPEQAMEVCLTRAKREIIEDVKAGYHRPESIKEFGDLHDKRDANEYGGMCGDDMVAELQAVLPALPDDDDSDTFLTQRVMRFAEDLHNTVNQWIKDGGIQATLLLEHLQAAHPEGAFSLADRDEVGAGEEYYTPADGEAAPPKIMVTVDSDGESIIDPFASGCGRFPINPEEYGITYVEAQAIRAHNRVVL